MTKYKNWLYPLAVLTVIFISSSTPGQTIDAIGLSNETLHINVHFLLFSLLCLSFYKATKRVLLSVMLTIIYSFLDEFHQSFIPERSSSFFDIQIDSLGAIVMGLILWKLQSIMPVKLKNWLNK